MSHNFKAPKRGRFYTFKRTDRVERMLKKIAHEIENEGQLQSTIQNLPPYAREDYLRRLTPYLRFKPTLSLPTSTL